MTVEKCLFPFLVGSTLTQELFNARSEHQEHRLSNWTISNCTHKTSARQEAWEVNQTYSVKMGSPHKNWGGIFLAHGLNGSKWAGPMWAAGVLGMGRSGPG